ncbi:helix-turn-helix transcriptional regulator [Brevundimonas sp. Root1423]|uniref:helix-turn-helix transcriptional regulator n=1 Tax=Brevundimonas sp. Root1423 TaxID=1736462 RepID=UPI0006FF9B0E|nr:helix-turn-helix transcriptional regulator [Brevundimonas sp. Root1423]KQY89828.1 hypothetical protein ASD25_04675 [Brevundimonas sp. Root1423]
MTDVASDMRHDAETLGLIDQIYRSITDSRLWSEWTSRLADRMGGRIRLHEPALGSTSLNDIFGGLAGEDDQVALGSEYTSPPARWVTETGFAPQGPARASQGALSRSGFTHALALQTTLGGKARTVLSLHRRATSGELLPRQRDMLDQLAPHMARAVHLRALIARAAAAGRAAGLALDMAHLGFLIVDSERRIELASNFAERAFDAGALSSLAGALDAADPKSTALLQQAIAAATRTARPKPSTFSIQGSGARYNLVVSPVSRAEGPSGIDERALVLLSPARSVTRDALQREYGLTPSEAALLCALINGQRLAEYAVASGLQLSTVKTHLRGVFMKTGEQRQADLIRRVLSDMMLSDPGARQ